MDVPERESLRPMGGLPLRVGCGFVFKGFGGLHEHVTAGFV